MAFNLSTLGGIGRGITRGGRDIQDWNDYRFKKGQQARLLEEQRKADELESGLRGIKPEGTYLEDQYGPPNPEGMPPLPKESVTRTAEQVARDQAAVYQRHGRVAEGAALSSRADTLQDRAKQVAAMQRIQDLTARYRANPEKFVLDEYNTGIPDGRLLVGMSTPKGAVGVHVDQKTGEALGTIPMTRDAMDAFYRTRIRMELQGTNDPNLFMQTLNQELGESQAAAQRATLGLKERELGIQEQHFKDQNKYWEGLVRAALARSGHENAQIKKLNELTTLMTDYGGNVEGLTRARGLGKEGAAAAQIYRERAGNIAAQLRALGVNPGELDPRRPDPQVRAEIFAKLTQGGMDPRQAMIWIDDNMGNVDSDAALKETLADLAGKNAAAGKGKKPTAQEAAATLPKGIYRESPIGMFNEMLSLAKKGDATGLRYLEDKLDANALTTQQRKQAEAVLGKK